MAKLELELQGNFDDILTDIERCLIVDEESSSDTTVGGNRCVVRTYSIGVNLTLMETGSSIRLIAVNTDDSYTSSVLGISTYSDNFYLDAIKDAVDKYRTDREDDACINPIETYLDMDEEDASSGGASVSSKEDINPKDDISSRVNAALSERVAAEKAKVLKNVKEDNEKEADKGVKVVCACADKNKDELHKSSYEHSTDTRYFPISKALSEPRRRRKNLARDMFLQKIANVLNSKSKKKTYDYEMLVKGLYNIVFGVVVLVLFNVTFMGIFDWRKDSQGVFIVFFVCLFSVFSIISGIAYVFKPTQMLYRKTNWGVYQSKFKYSEPVIHIGLGLLDQVKRDIEKSDEMILYDTYAKFCYEGNIVSWDYSDMVSIYETTNMFVVMVKNDYIYSFQKMDMRSETEEKVREILSPYYSC